MLLTIAAFVVALGVLIVIHEYGHYWVARRCGVRVLRFSVGFGKVLLQRTDKHGTEWALSAIPLGGYVKMLDGREAPVPEGQESEAFDRLSVWRRIAIVAAGPLANLLLASLLYAFLFMGGIQEPAPNQGPPLVVVQAVQPNSAAAEAGVQPGDVVLGVDQVNAPDPAGFVDYVGARANMPLALRVERAGQPIELVVVPQAVADDAGVTTGRMGVQIRANVQFVETKYGVVESLYRGAERTVDVAWLSLRMLGNMIIGQASWSNLSGPVTIADYAGQTARLGLDAYITFLAVVSVSLGILNLLPIPMLDGGHLLYYLVEIVRGSPPPERWFDIGQRAGLGLLLALMSVALFNDFVRLLG